MSTNGKVGVGGIIGVRPSTALNGSQWAINETALYWLVHVLTFNRFERLHTPRLSNPTECGPKEYPNTNVIKTVTNVHLAVSTLQFSLMASDELSRTTKDHADKDTANNDFCNLDSAPKSENCRRASL